MSYWQKDRHIEERNRIKILEVDPYIYGQLGFEKGAKTINGERIVFFINGTQNFGYPSIQKQKQKQKAFNSYLILYAKLNSK